MTRTQTRWQRPGCLSGPALTDGLRRGVADLVAAIRPTLGPLPRHVVNQPRLLGKPPEFLDDGAVIARRIIMLQDRVADVGAMYLRDMLWKMREAFGDGTATTAVLFHSVYEQGLRYIAAGGNAMILRKHLERAVPELIDALDRMSAPLVEKRQIAAFARSLCGDADLADVLGEAFDLLGPDGRLDIRAGRNRKLVLEAFDGAYWDGGLLHHATTGYGSGKITLKDAALLVTDLEIKEPAELIPLLDLARRNGLRGLVLVAAGISDKVHALLSLPANQRRIRVLPVKAPASPAARHENLEDLVALVGGRPMLQAVGDRLEAVRPEHLGRTRRAWADREYLGIEGGQGDTRRLRQHIADLRCRFQAADDEDVRKRLRSRLGRLLNGSAVLWVGAATPVAQEARQALAVRTAETVRGALRGGVLPGGGVALWDLQRRLLANVHAARDLDERMAAQILSRAVEAPIRVLLSNAGHPVEETLADLSDRAPGHGFDVLRGEAADMASAGIVDAAPVVKHALRSAITGAALALTIDVLIQRANPPMGVKAS